MLRTVCLVPSPVFRGRVKNLYNPNAQNLEPTEYKIQFLTFPGRRPGDRPLMDSDNSDEEQIAVSGTRHSPSSRN